MNTEMVSVYEGILVACIIPGDGNCLFSSIAHQLWNAVPGTDINLFYTRTLWALVVSFYEEQKQVWMERLFQQTVAIFP